MSKIKDWANIIKPKLKSKKVIVGLVILLLVIFLVSRNKSQGDPNIHEVKRGDFVKSVSVSGKVMAVQSAALSFGASGTVGGVYKRVGDHVYQGQVIAALNSSELQADREKANADLLAAQAELQKLKSASGNNTEITTNRRLVVNEILAAYTKSDDAIRNKVDQFYKNGRTAPEIRYTFSNYFSTKDLLNSGRKNVETILKAWEKEISGLTLENYKESNLDHAFSNLLTIKRFLDSVSLAVNSFEESSELSQATIDKYRTDIATARNNVNESMSSLTTISDGLRSSFGDIAVNEAKVKSAEAFVRSIDAAISEMSIRAPFAGIISKMDAKIGESVAANIEMVGLISEDSEIEAFVPEVNVTGIEINNPVEINLDAKPGDVDFTGHVTHIDPAETERDGVANYKIKIKPEKLDATVRPGMTVDVRILTGSRPDVITIPERASLKEDGSVFVDVLNGKETERRKITVGEHDGRGNIEVLQGLEAGESISLNPTVGQ